MLEKSLQQPSTSAHILMAMSEHLYHTAAKMLRHNSLDSYYIKKLQVATVLTHKY